MFCEYLRLGHYSYRTEQTYVGWIRQFVEFHGWRKPSTMEAGQDIRTVQDRLGHTDVKTTMIYTHVLNKGPMGVTSPVDTL